MPRSKYNLLVDILTTSFSEIAWIVLRAVEENCNVKSKLQTMVDENPVDTSADISVGQVLMKPLRIQGKSKFHKFMEIMYNTFTDVASVLIQAVIENPEAMLKLKGAVKSNQNRQSIVSVPRKYKTNRLAGNKKKALEPTHGNIETENNPDARPSTYIRDTPAQLNERVDSMHPRSPQADESKSIIDGLATRDVNGKHVQINISKFKMCNSSEENQDNENVSLSNFNRQIAAPKNAVFQPLSVSSTKSVYQLNFNIFQDSIKMGKSTSNSNDATKPIKENITPLEALTSNTNSLEILPSSPQLANVNHSNENKKSKHGILKVLKNIDESRREMRNDRKLDKSSGEMYNTIKRNVSPALTAHRANTQNKDVRPGLDDLAEDIESDVSEANETEEEECYTSIDSELGIDNKIIPREPGYTCHRRTPLKCVIIKDEQRNYSKIKLVSAQENRDMNILPSVQETANNQDKIRDRLRQNRKTVLSEHVARRSSRSGKLLSYAGAQGPSQRKKARKRKFGSTSLSKKRKKCKLQDDTSLNGFTDFADYAAASQMAVIPNTNDDLTNQGTLSEQNMSIDISAISDNNVSEPLYSPCNDKISQYDKPVTATSHNANSTKKGEDELNDATLISPLLDNSQKPSNKCTLNNCTKKNDKTKDTFRVERSAFDAKFQDIIKDNVEDKTMHTYSTPFDNEKEIHTNLVKHKSSAVSTLPRSSQVAKKLTYIFQDRTDKPDSALEIEALAVNSNEPDKTNPNNAKSNMPFNNIMELEDQNKSELCVLLTKMDSHNKQVSGDELNERKSSPVSTISNTVQKCFKKIKQNESSETSDTTGSLVAQIEVSDVTSNNACNSNDLCITNTSSGNIKNIQKDTFHTKSFKLTNNNEETGEDLNKLKLSTGTSTPINYIPRPPNKLMLNNCADNGDKTTYATTQAVSSNVPSNNACDTSSQYIADSNVSCEKEDKNKSTWKNINEQKKSPHTSTLVCKTQISNQHQPSNCLQYFDKPDKTSLVHTVASTVPSSSQGSECKSIVTLEHMKGTQDDRSQQKFYTYLHRLSGEEPITNIRPVKITPASKRQTKSPVSFLIGNTVEQPQPVPRSDAIDKETFLPEYLKKMIKYPERMLTPEPDPNYNFPNDLTLPTVPIDIKKTQMNANKSKGKSVVSTIGENKIIPKDPRVRQKATNDEFNQKYVHGSNEQEVDKDLQRNTDLVKGILRSTEHNTSYLGLSISTCNHNNRPVKKLLDVRMPRSYTRKTNRQSWSTVSMLKATEAVNKGEMGWLRASKVFGIPQATLRRHALKTNKVIKAGEKKLGRFKPIFPPEVERQLVEQLKLLEARFFGLTRKDVLSLAYLLAERNGFQHCFNNEKKNNADESALSTVQRPQKIFATTGRKQVGAITSAERGSHVTVVCCMSSNGNFVAPALIFPRKNMKKQLIDHAPPGTVGIAQESGWMTRPVFLQWLQHFQKFTKASTDEKVLLIIDGHSSHKYLDALIYAKQHGIVLLCLPPHCTHRMQPLDVSFFGPLKTYFDQEVSKWLKTHPGRVVTQFQIGALFTEAYGKAATIQNATNGFYKTGICPLNADVFPDHMFEAAETTNVPINNDPQEEHNIDNNPIAGPSSNSLPERENYDESQTLEKKVPIQKKEGSLTATVADLSPLPVGPFIAGQGKRKPRERQGTIVLNSTPNLEEAKDKTAPRVYEKRRAVTNQLLVDSEPAIEKVSKKRRIVTQSLLVESGFEIEEEPFSADEGRG